jgi:hypothetical protein
MSEVTVDGTPEPRCETDREMVLAFRPGARVEAGTNLRTRRRQYRIVCLPEPGKRPELGAWCGTEERAWQAACLKLGLRLGRRP